MFSLNLSRKLKLKFKSIRCCHGKHLNKYQISLALQKHDYLIFILSKKSECMNVCKSYNQRRLPRPTAFYPRHPTNYKFVNVTRHNKLIKIDYRWKGYEVYSTRIAKARRSNLAISLEAKTWTESTTNPKSKWNIMVLGQER